MLKQIGLDMLKGLDIVSSIVLGVAVFAVLALLLVMVLVCIGAILSASPPGVLIFLGSLILLWACGWLHRALYA